MRVAPSNTSSLIQQLALLTASQQNISQQISTGSSITSLGSKPAGVSTSIQYAAERASLDNFTSGASTVLSRMQATDSALGSVVTSITSVISLATQASNDSNSDSTRQSLIYQLQSVRSTLLDLANSSYQGTYLFAGSDTTDQPFTDSGSVSYTGSTNTSSITTTTGSAISTSMVGSDVFGTGSSNDVFAALDTLISNLSSGATADTLSGSITSLNDSLNNVISQRSGFDAAITRLTDASDLASTLSTSTQAAQSKLLTADTASLATQLSEVQQQISALSSTISITQKGSLFDYL